jgi:predicted neuraminidase
LHGDFAAIAHVESESQAAVLSQQFPEPNTNKFSRFLHGCTAFLAGDESARELEPLGRIDNRPLGLIEPSVVQLTEGTIVMLMRAEWGGFLWESRSHDRGATWTPATPTEIPNPSSMAQLLRLNDGRIALFLNPTGGEVGRRGPRDPLSVWISDDEMKTWGQRAVIATGGRCAYPHAIQTSDGTLLVAYDRDRRGVRLVRVEPDPGIRRQVR